MRYLLLPLIALLFTGCWKNMPGFSSKQELDTTTYEATAIASLETLKSSDQELFIHNIAPADDDMRTLLIYDMNKKLERISNADLKESYRKRTLSEIDRVTKNFDKEHEAIIKNIKIQWSDIEAKGYQSGIKWADAAFNKVEFIPQDILQVSNLKRGDVIVRFQYKKRDFRYTLYDCVKMPYERFRCVGIRELKETVY
jgi:hypothetical protein